jgi:hypothetical protein
MRVVNLGELHRCEYGRLLASLIRVVKDFDLAEDALQEAFASAASRGGERGGLHGFRSSQGDDRNRCQPELRRNLDYKRLGGHQSDVTASIEGR